MVFKMKLSILLFLIVASLILFFMLHKTAQINVGIVLPLSGEYQDRGVSIKNGLILARDIFNSKESNKRQNLNLFITDSCGIAEKAADIARELIEKKQVIAMIGGVTTEETSAIVSVCKKKNIVTLSPVASDSRLSGASEFFFRICPSDEIEGRLMAQKIKYFQFSEGIKFFEKTLIVSDTSEYTENIKNSFLKEYFKDKGEVIDNIEYNSDNPEFAGIIKRVVHSIRKEDSIAIYIIGNSQDTSSFLLTLRKEKRFDPQAMKIFISMKAFTEDFIKRTSDYFIPKGLNKYTIIFPMISNLCKDNQDPIVANFVRNYFNKYKLYPDIYAALGYDSVMLVVDSLSGYSVLSGDLLQDLSTLAAWKGVTGSISFNDKHDSENITIYGYDGKYLLPFEEVRNKGLNQFFVQVCK